MAFTTAPIKPAVLNGDGTNYALWKSQMKIYFKSIDERAWLAVLEGWTHPKKPMRDPENPANEVMVIKPEREWSPEERTLSNLNARAINAIFGTVDISCLRLISNCVEAREAWLILQEKCEGSTSVRNTKMRLLTTKFEIFQMQKDETILSYYEKLTILVNEAQGLGEPFSNARLVSKMLRSLPERFNVKISAIEEARDINSLEIGKLVSILTTFELNLTEQKLGYSGKGLAL